MMDTSGGKLSQLPCSLGEKLGGLFCLVFLRSPWKPVPTAHSTNLLINRPGIFFQVFHVSLPSLPSIASWDYLPSSLLSNTSLRLYFTQSKTVHTEVVLWNRPSGWFWNWVTCRTYEQEDLITSAGNPLCMVRPLKMAGLHWLRYVHFWNNTK